MRKKKDFSKVYSYSKLNLFEKCKRQYYFNYLDPEIAPIKKLFIKPKAYKTLGQAVHGALTLFYHLPAKDRHFERLKECLEKAWFSELEPQKEPPLKEAGGFKDLEEERRTYLEALKLLKDFFNLGDLDPKLFYLPTRNIRASFEDYENLITPLDGEFFVSGKFDRIDKLENGFLKIIDYKTGKENQDRFQLDFYKILAELNFGVKVSKLSFYYLATGRIKEFDVLDIEKGKIKGEVLKKINVVEGTKEFSPEPNKLCEYCDFKEICPAFKNQ